VRRRVVCDVPWGVLLSGGLDSSLVTALAGAESPRSVKTFAIGFGESTYDERAAAADVAARLGTEHHEVVLTPSGARELLPDVARFFDEPFADATALPAVLLARLARQHVTVTLSGDGGDELFCGYPTQTAHGAADLYARVPPVLHRALVAAAGRLPTSHRYLGFDFALRRFLREARRPALEGHLRWMGSFAPETLGRLLVPDVHREIRDPEPYEEAYDGIAPLRPRSAREIATALDLIFYLSEDNLVQADRSSMSTALEIRAPFLDRRLAEYALGLPIAGRAGLWRTHALPRRAARAARAARLLGHGRDVRRAGARDGRHGGLGDAAHERRAVPHQATAHVLALRGAVHPHRTDRARSPLAGARRARNGRGDRRPRRALVRRSRGDRRGADPRHQRRLLRRGAPAARGHGARARRY